LGGKVCWFKFTQCVCFCVNK